MAEDSKECIKLFEDYFSATTYAKWSYLEFFGDNHDAILQMELTEGATPLGVFGRWKHRWTVRYNEHLLQSAKDYTCPEIAGLSPFFTNVDWHNWNCIEFLRFLDRERPLYNQERPKLHQLYKDSLVRIEKCNPPPMVAEYIHSLMEINLKVDLELIAFWSNIKHLPNNQDTNMSDVNDYVLKSGTNVTATVLKENDVIVDLTPKAQHRFTPTDWKEMRDDFKSILGVLKKEIPLIYQKAFEFLCNDDDKSMSENLSKGYAFMLQEICEGDSSENPGLIGLHIAALCAMDIYLKGFAISNEVSESTLITIFFTPTFVHVLGDLAKKLLLKWGETSLVASASRRNSEIEDDDRVQMGQRTDVIGSLYTNRLEILLMEFSAPKEQIFGTKARTDRVKLWQGMKDALDRLLKRSLKWLNRHELRNVFVIGVQVVGCDVLVYAMNLAYNKVYRVQEIDMFTLPLNEEHFPFAFPATLQGFLRLKFYLSRTIECLEELFKRYARHLQPVEEDGVVEQMIYRAISTPSSPKLLARRNSRQSVQSTSTLELVEDSSTASSPILPAQLTRRNSERPVKKLKE